MLAKTVSLIVIALFFNSCAAGGSDSPAAAPAAVAVIGNDYSGTYIGTRIECYNPGLTVVTTYANITSGQGTLVINKNNHTTTVNAGSCVVNLTGTVEFMPGGVLNLRSRTVTAATSGACTATSTLSTTPSNTVSPTSMSTAYSNGQVFSAITGSYVRNSTTGDIALLSTYSNTASGTDPCYTILVKQ